MTQLLPQWLSPWIGIAFALAFVCVFYFIFLPQLIVLFRWTKELYGRGQLKYLWMPWKWGAWRDDGDQPPSSPPEGPSQP
jgi:hypothetical protein